MMQEPKPATRLSIVIVNLGLGNHPSALRDIYFFNNHPLPFAQIEVDDLHNCPQPFSDSKHPVPSFTINIMPFTVMTKES